ncbi:hypothetical protein F5887DRAFT_960983 [Amanita rubescens]|nr:hypothetical protein F5887DRAFT_960983 [Amanita rubescens]
MARASSWIAESSGSASPSPMSLTPDSTGTLSSGSAPSPSSPGSEERAGPNRRPTAVYPNSKFNAKTLKPFSRSAAKRESVLALGSIEHLQHYFTKTGLVANKDSLEKPHYGLVPAIGGASYLPSITPSTSTSSLSSSPPSTTKSLFPETFTLTLPIPNKPTFLPNQPKTYETDPDSLLPGVVDDLNAVTRAWNLDNDDLPPHSAYTQQSFPSENRPIVTISDPSSSTPVDVLELLKTTTRAIRSTRNYLVSLPDDSVLSPVHSRAHLRPMVLGPGGTPSKQNRHNTLSGHEAHTSSSSSSAKPPPDKAPDLLRRERDQVTQKHQKKGAGEPSTLVRKSALEVLAALREVEERYRLPLSDDAYDALSDGAGAAAARAMSPDLGLNHHHELDARHHDHDGDLSITYSLVQIQVGDRLEEVPVWENEESDSDVEEEKKRELWDERLVLGSGWLYRQDVRMEELAREREVVKGYLDVVDKVIFGVQEGQEREEERPVRGMERGWERERRRVMRPRSKGRRVSTGDGAGRIMAAAADNRRRVSTSAVELLRGMSLTEEPEEMEAGIPEGEEDEDDSVDDEDLPGWAKRTKFVGDNLGRAHALLGAFLSSQLLSALGSPHSRTDFLSSLSSGQLLCMAYNTCVRKSKKPWGYVSKDSIHDIISLEKAQSETESSEKKGWTFRRTDNLRLWAGALKLRYLLPIQTPNQPLNQTSLNSLKLIGHIQSTSSPGSTSHTGMPGPGTSPPKIRPVSSTEPVIEFDARIVARKDEGWEDMLEIVLLRWVQKVVEEKRSAR